ncbi:pyridoxal-phosphate dependent enzyme [Streptomyces sp. ISL-10]|uniref:pyridoxal-phosphate dependent enzyme n=1 Tax=Streptomyces sp. ISL-10 TaxID=2819172 RepID=UPI002034FA39|nr:pyridoxal-phosphate dependent enzyme [Streptomyces sp. ISL-10]
MKACFDHIADAVKLPDLVRLEGNLVVARFETMKVYSALAAVEHLLRTGRVRPGDTLMDSSSGTYAASLALACHKHGMKCHIVCSTKVDPSVVVQLELLGAVVDQVAIPPGRWSTKWTWRCVWRASTSSSRSGTASTGCSSTTRTTTTWATATAPGSSTSSSATAR